MHLEALTSEAKNLYPLLSSFPNFYLAGGTALALQIGHRLSVDFDLFSSTPIPKKLLDKVEKVFSGYKIEVLVNTSDELTILVDSVKITFLYYPFPLLSPLISLDKITAATPTEIGSMKAYTIGRRGSWKDYVDLYFIIKENYSNLDIIITTAEQKYNQAFNARLLLEQLIYLNDLGQIEISFLRDQVNKNEVEKFFKTEISKIKL